MTDKEAKETIDAMISMGMAGSRDEAVHMLVDAGEINSTQHAELLSAKERKRIYGD